MQTSKNITMYDIYVDYFTKIYHIKVMHHCLALSYLFIRHRTDVVTYLFMMHVGNVSAFKC